MISVMTPVKGSAGYVAVEQVTGVLSGKNGSFALQHFALMNKVGSLLNIEVVPGLEQESLQVFQEKCQFE